jgi:hypothetical protein
MPSGAAPSTLENELKWLAVTALIIFSALLGSLLLTEGHEWSDDFASVIMQAQSIVEGTPNHFVEADRFTVEQSDNREPGSGAYRWGTPLLLAPLYRLFGFDILTLKSLNVACYVLFLIALAFFFREKHSGVYFLALIAFFALNPRMLLSLNDILPDMPFLLVSTLTVFLIGHIIVERRRLISRAADYVLLGLLLAVAFFIRNSGVVLVLTAAATQILSAILHAPDASSKSFWKRLPSQVTRSDVKTVLVHVSPYLSFAALTWVAYHLLPHNISVQAPMSLETPSHGYFFALGAEFFAGLPHPNLVYAATFPFLAIGIVQGARADYHLLLYAFLTILFYVFSPTGEGTNYLIPLFPFYVHFLLVGLRWTSEALEIRSTAAVKYVTVVLLMLVAVYFFGFSRDQALANIYAQRKMSSGPFAETSQDVFSFIREKTPPDSVIVFFNPRVMRLFTGRRSITLDKALDLPRGNYLCLYASRKKERGGELSENIVGELVKGGNLRLMYANSDFRLYEIVK